MPLFLRASGPYKLVKLSKEWDGLVKNSFPIAHSLQSKKKVL